MGWVDPLGLAKLTNAPDFDTARVQALKNAGMTNPENVTLSKYDPITGTVIEFKGEGGAKVAYNAPQQTWTQRPDTINRILAGKLLVNADDAAALSEAISPTTAHNIHIAPTKNRKAFINQENSTSLKCEIKAALMAAGISAKEVENKGQVLSRVEASFVKDRPRAWWSSLAVAPKIYTFNDNSAYLHLDEVAPPTTDDVWLIVDEDNDEKFVFSLPLSKIKNIIEECRYFEYYIVDKNLKWLLAENDHGDLIFSEKNLTP